MKNNLLNIHSTMQKVCQELGLIEIDCMVVCTEAPFITLKLAFIEDNLMISIAFEEEELETMSNKQLVDVIVMYYNSKDSSDIGTASSLH